MSLPLPELKKRGWQALVKELGYAEATRFLLMFEKGEGDYLKEKEKIFKNKKAAELYEEIKKLQSDFE